MAYRADGFDQADVLPPKYLNLSTPPDTRLGLSKGDSVKLERAKRKRTGKQLWIWNEKFVGGREHEGPGCEDKKPEVEYFKSLCLSKLFLEQ